MFCVVLANGVTDLHIPSEGPLPPIQDLQNLVWKSFALRETWDLRKEKDGTPRWGNCVGLRYFPHCFMRGRWEQTEVHGASEDYKGSTQSTADTVSRAWSPSWEIEAHWGAEAGRDGVRGSEWCFSREMAPQQAMGPGSFGKGFHSEVLSRGKEGRKPQTRRKGGRSWGGRLEEGRWHRIFPGVELSEKPTKMKPKGKDQRSPTPNINDVCWNPIHKTCPQAPASCEGANAFARGEELTK